MKYIDLSCLPKKIYKGRECIDWNKSEGMIVSFKYQDIIGDIKLIKFLGKPTETLNPELIVSYKNKDYNISVSNLQKCAIGRVIGVRTNEFKIEINSVFCDKNRNIKIIDRWRNPDTHFKYYKYECNICGFKDGVSNESDLLIGQRCSCCTSRIVVKGINDIPTTAPWMVKYFQGGINEASQYVRSSSYRIFPICPDCGRIKTKSLKINTIYTKRSIGCSCGDIGKSYPEKFMSSVLDQLKVSYIWGYRPDWLRGYKSNRPLEFDFYLLEQQIILEIDGGIGHNKKVYGISDKDSVEETRKRDEWKDAQAHMKNISVIRICADESTMEYMMDNIVKSLKDIFDLSKIDWHKCDEQATKNIIKEVCEFYETNKQMMRKDIASEFKIGKTALLSYLKKGHKFGWCTYVKSSSQKDTARKKFSKEISVLKNNVIIKTYPSVTELIKNSTTDFNTSFTRYGISKVVNNLILNYKGYTFKYVV